MSKPQRGQHLAEDGRMGCKWTRKVIIAQEVHWSVKTLAQTTRIPYDTRAGARLCRGIQRR